jgi:hypothetical protein
MRRTTPAKTPTASAAVSLFSPLEVSITKAKDSRMKTLIRLSRFTLPLIVLYLSVAAMSANAATTLRWKLTEGTKLRHTMRQDTTITPEIKGVAVPSGASTITAYMVTTWDVGKSSRAVHDVALTIDRLHMATSSPLGKHKFDSSVGEQAPAIKNAPIALKLKPTGQFVSAKIAPAMIKALTADPNSKPFSHALSAKGIQQIVEQLVTPLAANAVNKGDTWKSTHSFDMPGLGKATTVKKFTYAGQTKRGEQTLEKITFTATLDFGKSLKKFDGKITEQKAEGVIYFDNVAGRLADYTVKQTMTIEVTIGKRTIKQTVVTSETGKVTLVD